MRVVLLHTHTPAVPTPRTTRYTSGTSGAPKGVVVTRSDWRANAMSNAFLGCAVLGVPLTHTPLPPPPSFLPPPPPLPASPPPPPFSLVPCGPVVCCGDIVPAGPVTPWL